MQPPPIIPALDITEDHAARFRTRQPVIRQTLTLEHADGAFHERVVVRLAHAVWFFWFNSSLGFLTS